MSTEDVLAREAAISNLDMNVPMGLEVTAPVKPKRRTKLDPRAKSSKAGYQRALRLAAKERREVLAAETKVRKAQERLEAKAADRQAKIDAAAEGYCDLPAVVLRDGTVKSISPTQAVEVIDKYLDALGVDVEHSGYDVGDSRYELRTVQLGGEEMTVVLDPASKSQAAIIKWALANAEKLHAFAAIADIIPLVLAGFIDWDSAWGKMYDGVLYVKLTDPRLAGSEANGLKDLSRDLLREYAVSPEAEKKKNALFKAIGCNINTDSSTPSDKNGWNMVDKRAVAMIRYAGCDVLDLAAVLRFLPPLPVSEQVLDREREVQADCARVALVGFALDYEHTKVKIAEHEESKARHRYNVELLTEGKITNPSAPGVGAAMIELWPHLNTVLDRSEDTGEPSAAKKSLAKIQGNDIDAITAKEILAYRHDVTTLSLLLRPLENLCVNGDARMRPTVYTINADTGRMCLPVNHALLTRTGYRAWCYVQPGDETLDADGNWVKVLWVHHYEDAMLVSVDSRGLKLSATPEHRWVTTLEHRPQDARELRTVSERPRLRLHLAPPGGFDFDYGAVQADTEDERFAALVGMLVTDGRCIDTGDGEGLRAYVYQTEKKYYRQFLRVIPENAVMYDRITNDEDHHEIRIKARWLRPKLEAAGLGTKVLLAETPGLYHWIAERPLNELRAFFSACWLSDGTKAEKGRVRSLSCGSILLRQALTFAAYRLGYVTREHIAGPSEWSNGERRYLTFREPVISTHRNAPFDAGHGEVWCVTTETGTFTAVTPTGTAYLTGNSCVRPNGQQFSRRGGIRACVCAGQMNLEMVNGKWEVVLAC